MENKSRENNTENEQRINGKLRWTTTMMRRREEMKKKERKYKEKRKENPHIE